MVTKPVPKTIIITVCFKAEFKDTRFAKSFTVNRKREV